MEAADTSPESTESPSRRRGSKRRVKPAATLPDSAGSCIGAVRVLRARGAAAHKSNDLKNASCEKQTPSLHGGRRKPAGSSCKNTLVMKPKMKKLTAKKASKNSLGTKLSKSKKGKRRLSVQASHTSPATCKPRAKTEDSLCGEKSGSSKQSNNVSDPDDPFKEDPLFRDDPNDKPETQTGKSKWHAASQKEIKKEEEDIKKEELAKSVVQNEDNAEGKAEPPQRKSRQQKDDKATRLPKQRKKPPVQYVRCEIEGCGTVLAHPRYLQHHIKYQHMLKKKYICDHPTCGRLFRLQKQLLRHAKHHTDQRDYICEYCARAFKSSHNLAVHRMIHTGEKPIQCEICGFTCRQKASLNWHMKKHDAEASFQFSCNICNKKFEKKDSVVAHKAKSHPEVLIAEALAANGGAVISTPIPVPESVPETAAETVPETVPVLTQPETPSVSQESHEAESGSLTPLEQVVLPFPPQTQVDVPQSQFLQLPSHHVVQVAHQQQAPTLLHLTTATPTHLSSTQLIQLSTFPVMPMSTADHHSTLVTLSPVTTATLVPHQQAVQWDREAEEEPHVPGEGKLWERVVVGDREMEWEGS